MKIGRMLRAAPLAVSIFGCTVYEGGDSAPGTAGMTSSTGQADTAPTNTTTGNTTSTEPGSTGTVTPTTTQDASTSGGASTTGDPTTPTTEPCADSGGFIDCNTSTGPQPNGADGADCADDSDCESMNCYSNQLFMISICAECNEDADCVAAGTGTACTLDIMTQSASCTTGEVGSSCMSDEACMSGHCDAVIDFPIPGLLPDTCGECSSSADCAMSLICSPVFDIMAFSGQKQCVEPGSVENNQLCPADADGDLACKSAHCTEATFMGIVPVNICGECAIDADCAMGQTCMPAEASMSSLNGSLCV
jgi:hypothetical protein